MLALFNPDLPDWITRDTVEAFAEANPEEADAIRALLPGHALAFSIGGGGFNVIVHETENYHVEWAPYDEGPLPEDDPSGLGYMSEAGYIGATGQYIGIHSGRPEAIEWEAL